MEIPDQIPTEIIQCVSTKQARHYGILPFKRTKEGLFCLIDEQRVTDNIDKELELVLRESVHLSPVQSDVLLKKQAKYYKSQNDGLGVVGWEDFNSAQKEVLTALFSEAYSLNVSDIHLEPYENYSRIRFRLNGILFEKFRINRQGYAGLVNKIKIKSKLDISEKRLPQDGRITAKIGQKQFDIRVSTIPTLHGEKVVMRILGRDAGQIELKSLGFHASDLKNYLRGIQKPNGMILISGPTGSGKTTTLYGTLKLLNKAERNIITIEDPIEYTMTGANQVQLKENIGLTYPRALKTFLRQDPDIIMVGEIRDEQTASMGIRASLTGHLVLSTIHTNSAWGIIGRMLDMGVPAYLLADTLNTVVAQRLIRVLCEKCKTKERFDINNYPAFTFSQNNSFPGHIFMAGGCTHCGYTGYSGRSAVYEVILVNDHLADRIRTKELNIAGYLKESGHRTLAQNAMEKLSQGRTSIEEIAPIISYG